MSLVWEIHWPTQSQLLVALKLADHAHNDGSSVYPAKSSIARQAQCSESTVQNALRAFRSCGLLHVVQEGGTGPRSPTVYAINVELLEGLASIQAKLEGGADSIEIPENVYEIATGNKGSTVDPLGNTRGQPDTSKGSTEASKGSIALTPNHHLKTTNTKSPEREGFKSVFGSEAVLLTMTSNPQALIAWEKYAAKRSDQHEWRVVKRLISAHGAWHAPSEFPPDFAPNQKEAAG